MQDWSGNKKAVFEQTATAATASKLAQIGTTTQPTREP
nr:MAG TPA: hypothetical protein [Caudoviricetes sp.]